MSEMPKVAYFCMEYGLHEKFPIYSGGLGVLAGDHLKAAKELEIPLIGVGILWRQGYTNQIIDKQTGWPRDDFADQDFDCLKETGITIKLDIGEEQVISRVWLVDKYDNAPLYLIDTDLPENSEQARQITARLYGGDSQLRVAQEMVLGIGGVRLLRELGFNPDIYHFNEGHAVLAGIELIREEMVQGKSFSAALSSVRQKIVFTTHTPVPAGNESHPLSLFKRLGAYNGLDFKQLRKIGGNPFNMTVAGLRLASIANGVSKLHAQTARQMWKRVTKAAPIIPITNGVHRHTWQDSSIVRSVDSETALWEAHQQQKRELLAEIDRRTGVMLNETALLIGFARRATGYKRADLIFEDMEQIGPFLENGRLQLVFSGKAHPKDEDGKRIIAKIYEISQQFPNSVLFLENYDMKIGRLLTRGCDVWLNNPTRPQEASGTSGMKAAMNGVLNLSILDGWWPEGCQHGVNGWKIATENGGENSRQSDARALYQVLLDEVVPTYYTEGTKWIEMMRSSIGMASEQFSAKRMLNEYLEKMYRPTLEGQLLAAAKE